LELAVKNSLLRFAACFATLASVVSCFPNRVDVPEPVDTLDRPYVIQLPADPFERGRVHGESLRDEIQRQVEIWKVDLSRSMGVEVESFIKDFLAETYYLTAIERWTPDLLVEIGGIAEGSGLPFETILVYNLLDEVWLNGSDIADGNHCSALGVPGTESRPALVAQNMDVESFRNGFQTVLKIAGGDGEPDQIIFTTAGMIALNGVNEAGVGVVVNALSQLRFAREGLPVAFVIRGLLARTEESALRDFLTQVSHASGQSYTVGARDKVFAYEASAGKVVEYRPDNREGVITHTNHPLVNDNLNAAARERIAQTPVSDLEAGNSRTRMRTLLERLDRTGQVDSGWIEETLNSRDSPRHPVCRAISDGTAVFTFGSTIMRLGEEPALFLATGPPAEWVYLPFEFR
jgi:hypothetical protein